MGIDWGQALAGGVAAGAGAVQYQQQQSQEDARWLDREKQLMSMQTQAQAQREKYLLALKPPEVDKQTVTDPTTGRPQIQNRQWVPPSDADITAGTPGHFNVTSTENVPRKLGQRSYQSGANEVSELYDTDTGESVRQMGSGPKWDPSLRAIEQAKLGVEQGHLALDQANAARDKGDVGKNWQVETAINPDGTGSFVRVNKATGESQPISLGGKPLTTFRGGEGLSQAYQDAQKTAKQESDAANQAIDDQNRPGLLSRAYGYVTGNQAYSQPQAGPPAPDAGSAPPMAQFAGGNPGAAPAGGSASRPAPYTEGQIIYDKQGNAYKVQNGQPVPMNPSTPQ